MGLLESAHERMLANEQREFDILKNSIELNKEGALTLEAKRPC